MTTQEIMTTEEIAKDFYALAQQGKWNEIIDKYFSADAESREPATAVGLPSVKGIDKIKGKGKQWEEMIEEVYGGYCHEPTVVGNHFACAMGVDLKMKGRDREKMDELAVYQVRDGKIVLEQFFY